MDNVLRQIEATLPNPLPARLGVAVSGGSDSTALLVLLKQLCGQHDTALSCVTVDHGLRPEAAREAAGVAALCKTLGIPHRTLVWTDWDGRGNTQNAARQARYALMAEWAVKNDIQAIALGHTKDDQAETVVMQLARGAGVDGLSAMPVVQQRNGVTWLRPLLDVTREDLRQFLRAEGVSWFDDPSNEDVQFDRVRVRQALKLLEPLGVDADALSQVARNMQSARDALVAQTVAAAQTLVNVRAGGLQIALAEFNALSEEIARRLVAAGIRWIAPSTYAPRGKSLNAALRALNTAGSATLKGCRLLRKDNSVWVFREYEAVRENETRASDIWDARWAFEGLGLPDLTVRALGPAGLAQCPDWRDTALPRALLEASPGLWQGGELVAAPLAGWSNGYQARLEKGESSFFQGLISH